MSSSPKSRYKLLSKVILDGTLEEISLTISRPLSISPLALAKLLTDLYASARDTKARILMAQAEQPGTQTNSLIFSADSTAFSPKAIDFSNCPLKIAAVDAWLYASVAAIQYAWGNQLADAFFSASWA